MGKAIKRVASALCMLVLCISVLSVVVFAASTVTAKIPVQITLGGTLPAEPETFVVEVTADDPAYPMPDGAENGVFTMQMAGASTGTIEIEFDDLGVYKYTVKQVAGTNDDCTYDTAVYYVTAYVTNSESGTGYDLSVVIYRDDETEKCDGLSFENIYANPDEVVITAIKTLDGKTPADGAFTFELVDAGGQVVATAQNVGKTVTFAPLQFSKVGTFVYQLREVRGSDSKIIYDKVVYDVIVEVVKDEDGNYDATVTYQKNGKDCNGAPVFSNKTKSFIPQTGDDARLSLWIALLAVSAMAIIALSWKMKKRA